MLTFALVMSALMGIFQETLYKQYGKHSKEALFYNVSEILGYVPDHKLLLTSGLDLSSQKQTARLCLCCLYLRHEAHFTVKSLHTAFSVNLICMFQIN